MQVQVKLSDICCQEWLNTHNYSGSRWSGGSKGGGGGVSVQRVQGCNTSSRVQDLVRHPLIIFVTVVNYLL